MTPAPLAPVDRRIETAFSLVFLALFAYGLASVMGWIGGGSVRGAVMDRAESAVSCAYDHAIRTYYRSPVIIELHSRFDQLMENS